MIEPVELESREEVDLVRDRGHEPLMLFEVFLLSPLLREELIREIFPRYSTANNARFYRWYWDNYPGEHRCEECSAYLSAYSAHYVSHILPRGAYPHFAYDPRNINLLCAGCHDKWGAPDRRKGMKIYKPNQDQIQILLEGEREIKRLTTFVRPKKTENEVNKMDQGGVAD